MALLLRCTVVAFSAYFLLVLQYVILRRIRYPFELEWLEGSLVDQVVRLLHEQPLYVEPGFDQIAYQYTPLYFHVSAWVSRLVGVGFFPLRLVSFASATGCQIVLFVLVARETGSRWSGLLAAGLFAATFRLGGAWFDLARVDMLALFLSLLGLAVFRWHPATGGQAVAGILFFLAFFTKQTAGFVAVPLAVWALLARRGPDRFVMPAVAGLLLVTSTLYMNRATGGWYWYYVVDLLRQHRAVPGHVLGFFARDLAPMFVPVALVLHRLLEDVRHGRRAEAGFAVAVLAGYVLPSWAARVHEGGYDNTLIPAFCAFALLAALAAARHLSAMESGETWQRRWAVAVVAALGLHFALLVYDVEAQIPAARDEQAGRRFLAEIASLPGDVYVPWHGYVQSRVGKQPFAQGMTVYDIFRGTDRVAQKRLQAEIDRRLEQRSFSAIVLDVPPEPWLGRIHEFYQPARHLFTGDEFYPVTGLRTRPMFMLVPRPRR